MAYTPIQDYGLIGNMRTAALVNTNGSIDWLCLPHFDSPSVFGRILDERKAGHFSITPTTPSTQSKQYYWPSTNILVTQFLHSDGVAELQDYMPIPPSSTRNVDQIIRRMVAARGSLTFRIECKPAFDYARSDHKTSQHNSNIVFESTDRKLTLALATSLKSINIENNAAVAEFTLHEGETAIFVVRMIDDPSEIYPCPSEEAAEEQFRATVQYWRNWIGKSHYQGRWRETVERSALALKLLTFEPTGAIIAAPTTSLPEHIGGVRNWDYRYVWIRDASFTLYALLRLGFREEAVAFMNWILRMLPHPMKNGPNGPLRLIYSIRGESDLPEETLDHLEGYMGSAPVRIGNRAVDQLQLDIYGELMDSVYLYNKYAAPLGYDQWSKLRDLIDWLCENWSREDNGIWEVRGERRQFLYSKVMSWVAFDRAIRLADKRSLPANRQQWFEMRDCIYEVIMEKGWNETKQSFVQSFGSENLDASALLMPLTFFMAANDPRMLSTIDAINKPASKGGLVSSGMVFRYNTNETDDGLPPGEGTFNMCSFWLVEALTRAGAADPRRLEEARLLFEHMLGNANHLRLYSEQCGLSGNHLGNFPQAFTHIALISAAFNLDRTLSQR